MSPGAGSRGLTRHERFGWRDSSLGHYGFNYCVRGSAVSTISGRALRDATAVGAGVGEPCSDALAGRRRSHGGVVPRRFGGTIATLASAAASSAVAVLVGASAWFPLAVSLLPWVVVLNLPRTRAAFARCGGTALLLYRGAWVCSLTAVVGVLAGFDRGVAVAGMLAVTVGACTAAGLSLLWSGRTGGRRVVLVGDGPHVEMLAVQLWRARGVDVAAACVLPTEGAGRPGALIGVPTTSDLCSVAQLADDLGADCVVLIPGPSLASEQVRQLAWSLERSRVALCVSTNLDWVAPHRVAIEALGGATLVGLRPAVASTAACVVKRLMDRTVAGLLLVCVAPLLAAMWLAVRVECPGPSFFRQTRVGKDGELFTMYKVRTMSVDAEERRTSLEDQNEVDQTLFKMREDPRITRVGKVLRRTSLDELPQLVNVVRGQMSLVGPRPALPGEVATYDAFTRRRLAVKPGITGLWQVSGRSDLTWEESIRLDLHYVDNWRLVDDLVIAAKTVNAVTQARGAY